MVYFKNNYLSIRYDESLDILFTEWLDRVSSAQYREGMQIIMQMIRENNFTKWLINSRNLAPMTISDQRWTNEMLFRELVDSPLTRVARIPSEEIMNQLIINNMVEHIQEIANFPVKFAQFTDQESAQRWLLSDVFVK